MGRFDIHNDTVRNTRNFASRSMARVLQKVCVLALVSLTGVFIQSCRKAGLAQTPAHLDIVGAYRVADEGVDYLFFELTEIPEVLESSQWFYSFDDGNGDFDGAKTEWKPLDLSTGVHLHKMVLCGSEVRCGSFSWPSNIRKQRIALRMLYHPEGSADLTTSASIKDFGTNLSSMVFGVYDSSNSRIQVRVEDNFGVPSKENIKRYGMTRKFQVRAPESATVTTSTMSALRTSRQDNYLFPADFCTASQSSTDAHTFLGGSSWLAGTFPTSDGANGACMNVDFMDKNGAVLAKHTAYARRNPRFQSGSYKYATPLAQATKIPIILSYCADAVGADTARDEDFLEYQRNIIGFGRSGEDLCFRIGSDATFRSSLTNLLASKLATAKAAATGTTDFIFVVVLHQNLSTEFRTFHQIVAEELAAIATSESSLVSPRLVGGFVYDSRSDFRPSGAQEKFMIWCPSLKAVDPSSSVPPPVEANCIVSDPVKIGGALINFVTPMGPFPTLSSYQKYVNQYSDRGLAKKPDISFASVIRNGSTFTETVKKYKVTYFDNEHLIVATNDRVHVCWDASDSTLLTSLRLRSSTQDSTTAGMDIVTAQSLWSIGQGTGDYRIGVAWELPFIGKITYKSPVTVNVVSLIPISRSFSDSKLLGDPKWLAESLDFGRLLQVCKEYCNHPWFDGAGVYQVSSNYGDSGFNACVAPKYPTVSDEAANGG
jgi:hypothetical protein